MSESTPAPIYYSVFKDDSYIFSNAFYNPSPTEKMSQLEVTVKKYLDNKPVAEADVSLLFEAYKTMNALDKFYYTPILIILAEYARNGNVSEWVIASAGT